MAASSSTIKIAHIADIHIGSSTVRSNEYRKVFDNFKESLTAHPIDIVVIAGDIFHKKTVFSGTDVSDFKYLLQSVPPGIDIILIPGNHDSNLNDIESCDLIEPVISPITDPRLIWSKYTEVFSVRGLKFLHVSVFDDSTVTQLAEKYAADAPETILLYHGFIAGAVFGKHTVRDKETRITMAFGNAFRAVLAGDIHGMQIFGAHKHIAYSGSMIQQNISEDTNKGYLVWEFNPGTRPSPPTFIQLVNTSAMIRLDVRGKTNAEVEEMLAVQIRPDNLLKVALYTDAEDSTEQQRMIIEKFGRVDKINFVGIATNPTDNEEIEDTLTDLLINQGIDIDAAEEIIVSYKERMSVDNRRWYIRSLEFDNMFKYGAGNYIDFTKLNGISGVVAANRAGKSSIIDVIVYTLFNKLLRGDKNSVINFNKTTARSVVTFVVVPDEYIIEKTMDKLGHVKVTLKKNGINITNASIIETYKTITALVGTIDQFCMTGLFYNDNHNIVTLKATERMKILPLIIGVADEQILADTKVKIKNLKQLSAAIPKGDPTAATILTAVQTQYDTAAENLKIAEARLHTATEFKDFLYSDPSLYVDKIASVQSEIDELKTTFNQITPPAIPVLSATPCILSAEEKQALSTIAAEIQSPPEPLPPAPVNNKGYPVENIEEVRELAGKQIITVDTNFTTTDLNAAVKLVTQLESLVASDPKEPPASNEYSREEVAHIDESHVAALKNDIIKSSTTLRVLEQTLEQQGTTPPVPELKLEAVSLKTDLEKKLEIIDVPSLEQQVETFTQQVNAEHTAYTRAISEYNSRKANLKAQIETARGESRLTFASNCTDCAANSLILAKDLAEKIALYNAHISTPLPTYDTTTSNLLAEQTSKLAIARSNMTTLTAAIQKIEKHMSDHYQGLAAATTHNARVESIRSRIAEESANLLELNNKLQKKLCMFQTSLWYKAEDRLKNLSEAIARRELITKTLKANEANTKILAARVQLENHIAYEEYSAATAVYREKQASHIAYERITAAKAKLTAAKLYEDYLTTTKINTIQSNISTLTALLTIMTTELEKISSATLPIPNIITAHTEIMLAQRAIGSATTALSTAKENMAIRERYIAEGLPLDQQLNNQERYKDCLTDGRFRSAIVTKVLDKIIQSINSNLKEISDFTITSKIENDRLELFIVEREHELPIELASGFQRFIISLMFRIAVTMNRCEFLIIDEGFGCLDETNMRSVIEFFSTITHCYRFLFVISHVSEMHAALTTPLIIKTIATDSYICNRSEDPAVLAVPDAKIQCGCGAIYAAVSHKAHLRTRKHQEWEAAS